MDFGGDAKGSSGKDFHQAQLLTQESATLITKPNFVSTLCYAIDNPLHQQKVRLPMIFSVNAFSEILIVYSLMTWYILF